MKLDIKVAKLKEVANTLVVPVFEDRKEHHFEHTLKQLSGFKGEASTFYVWDSPKNKVIFVGLGKHKDADLNALRNASGTAAKVARECCKDFTSTLHQADIKGTSVAERAQASTEGFLLALHRLLEFKTKDKDKIKHLKSITLISNKRDFDPTKTGAKRAEVLTKHANLVKDMSNKPANHMTPEHIANIAKTLAKEAKIKCTVYNKKQIQKLKLPGLLNVNKGSAREPRFIILDYKPKNAKKTIMLVGKGITFDTGGINLKPSRGLTTMKFDMAGAAVMLNAAAAAAKLKLPHRVIALALCTENMPDGDAYIPGDIIKMYNGLTVEVNNTDAEGRLVLADGLAYGIKTFKPDAVFDAATLTGAAIIALGEGARSPAAVVTNNKVLLKNTIDAGEYTQERVWELPIFDYHKELLKSKIADISNIGLGSPGEAGTITAGAFLQHFVGDTPWVHLDIAGTGWSEKESDITQSGATGWGIRLLINTIERL